jgi:hypothetical protein
MALISKDNRKWASTTKYAKWFCVIPMAYRYHWEDYPEATALDGYSVRILSYKEFEKMFFLKGWGKKDGFIYAITKDMTLDELLGTISTSVLDGRKGEAPEEFELLDNENIGKCFK